jgi:cytochrome c peroxidase
VAILVLSAALVLLTAASTPLPPGFPPPVPGADGTRTAPAQAELGRRLFYDRRLSGNGTQSCGTCHEQRRAFTDGRATAIGSTGQRHSRNTMTLTNVAYNATFTWSDASVRSLEQQARVPLFGTHPVEMGMGGNEREVMQRLRADAEYAPLFKAAFPASRRPMSLGNVIRAIAAFERTLISGRSPYDRLVFSNEEQALSAEAWRGMKLFFSTRVGCAECHGGLNFSGPMQHAGAPRPAPRQISNGVTEGLFRVPTLRNITLTGPYMHDGRFETLEAVVEAYNARRRLDLTSTERKELIAFLHSLTDTEFIADERFSDPW